MFPHLVMFHTHLFKVFPITATYFNNLVGPAGMISGSRKEYITATCKQNVIQEKLPGWDLEISVDEIIGAKCKKYNFQFDSRTLLIHI